MSRRQPTLAGRLRRLARPIGIARRFDELGPAGLRRAMNVYPPLLFAGTRITHISDDWSTGTIEMRIRWWNANMHRAAFGGSLYAMTDVLFGTLMMKRLDAARFEAWTRTGSIEYLRPGKGVVRLDTEIPDEMVDAIIAATADGASTTIPHTSVLRDRTGEIVAVAHQELYVRRRDIHRPSGFSAGGTGPLRGHALLSAARAVAGIAHRDQVDKGGRPYIDHVERVSRRCASPEARATGLLHDVLEDGGLSAEDLVAAGIPATVIAAVELLTRRPGQTDDEYYAVIRTDELAVEVKRADVADNSDPRRLDQLDAATRERLEAKYAKARAALGTR